MTPNDVSASSRRLRVLLSEGSSTSAREAITVLGLSGHHVEVCDPQVHCLGRFSRFVAGFHRCPPLSTDPKGYVTFIRDLVSQRRFDVLLPIHEQGLALAKASDVLAPHVAFALPSFAAYRQALDKAAFSKLLTALELPQPRTQLLHTREELLALDDFPYAVKAAVGTASRAVWHVTDRDSLTLAADELARGGAFTDVVLAQDWLDAPIEHAQAVFDRGQLRGLHAYRQIARGAGGGDAVKDSVDRPAVRDHLARIGAHLGWHGALSVDYLARGAGDDVAYIDCNPRLVEPMSAQLAGCDLLGLLLQVSVAASPAELPPGQPGVRSHLALQALLGCALRTGSRLELARECGRLAMKRGIYQGSREELTPLRADWLSVVPTLFAAAWLLIRPEAASTMARAGWGEHLLNPETIRQIEGWNGP
ncbi:hypothetical protein [Bradyrhizobium sp. LHD-71]|uniref:hypothetical protein n=1 Tax=Bradyrhizobium sp. LHD-71 TaxID=3072141 RepID=UPI00280D0CC4|nr:hypothetical protein [Bradyrhizobium sp. LHD-71]MDQ8732452.1 hypothetical protein [Bradyrhizobium sp. LHD-71]